MKTQRPKILARRKIGNLWQVMYGIFFEGVVYGYDCDRTKAGQKAKLIYYENKN